MLPCGVGVVLNDDGEEEDDDVDDDDDDNDYSYNNDYLCTNLRLLHEA